MWAVFAGDFYYPSPGMKDCKGIYSTYEEAMKRYYYCKGAYDWADYYDLMKVSMNEDKEWEDWD